ncbi:diguanylate cyclase [Candidatus Dependentiae bacterium]|nr:diguanylate cyclase [Candidatus Dependentiae bacterium]
MFYISPFKLSMYFQCPLKYRFHYLDKLDKSYPKPENDYLILGNIVHRTLKEFFLQKRHRSPEYLLELLKYIIDNENKKNSQVKDDVIKTAEELIGNFIEKFDLTINPEFLEENINVNIQDFKLLCKIDRIDLLNNGYGIIDYKTGRIQLTRNELQKNLPIKLYFIGAKHGLGLEIEKLTLLYLHSLEEISIGPTASEIKIFEEELIEQVNIIRNTKLEDFIPKTNSFCGFCEFKLFCSEFKNKTVQFNIDSKKSDFLNKVNISISELIKMESLKRLQKKIPEVFRELTESDWSILYYDFKNKTELIIRDKKNDSLRLPPKNLIIKISKQAITSGKIFKFDNKNFSVLSFPYSSEDFRFNSNLLIPLKLDFQLKEELQIISYTAINLLNQLFREYKNYESKKDGLTGLFMQRYFKEEVEKMAQASETFSVILCDIDFFKRVNDNHGHLFGDYILQSISAIIKENLREIDFCARYGGEEFGIILPGLDEVDAFFIAERIRKRIKRKSFKVNNSKKLKLTISLGISVYPRDGMKALDLISKADKALYKAKETGRNKTSLQAR